MPREKKNKSLQTGSKKLQESNINLFINKLKRNKFFKRNKSTGSLNFKDFKSCFIKRFLASKIGSHNLLWKEKFKAFWGLPRLGLQTEHWICWDQSSSSSAGLEDSRPAGSSGPSWPQPGRGWSAFHGLPSSPRSLPRHSTTKYQLV